MKNGVNIKKTSSIKSKKISKFYFYSQIHGKFQSNRKLFVFEYKRQRK